MDTASKVVVITNNLPHPSDSAAVEAAVRRALAGRPGEWRVILMEPHNASYWQVSITGPLGPLINRRFDGPAEQDPHFIEQAIQVAVQAQPLPTFGAIEKILEEKWLTGKSCIVCGNLQWSVSQLPYSLQQLGNSNQVIPLYPVTCTNCGLTFLFNAIQTGLLPEGFV